MTFVVVLINGVLGAAFTTLGEAMTYVGATINPIIGFILPVILMWP